MVKNVLRRCSVAVLVALIVAAVVVPQAAQAAQLVHVVRPGETLHGIAARYGTTAYAIARANGVRNLSIIYVGQRLVIAGKSGGSGGLAVGGSVHIVRLGETLASIAYRYGTTLGALASANGIRNPSLIFVGQRLTIPGRSGGSSGWSGYVPPAGGGSKWIEVDLSSQRVYAHQGNAVVATFVVSTGVASYPTPPGQFRIYAKYQAVTMTGPGYYLPGVPHTMFFYRGYALHGTYWHHNFGHPMSHGCINLTQGDAAWLYSWAPMGTLVSIHW